MNPTPASPPAVCFVASRRSRRRFRPRAAALLALGGLLAAAAVPTSLLTTAATAHKGVHPAGSPAAHATGGAIATVAALAGPSARESAAVSVSGRGANADGSNLAARLAKDAALRRTLQELQSGQGTAGTPAASVVVGGSVADIPAVALAAYQHAAVIADDANPGCDISWTLVAGIGRVESDHGQYGGSRPDAVGEVQPPILGPVLDGTGGNAAIPDTDGGRYDGDTSWDRAVGPMQFLPSTWAIDGRDGNGDGVRDPENLFDAALATADYLCASGGDLNTPAAAERAVFSYNHSLDYVLVVLGYSSAYGGQDLSPVTADIAAYLAALAKAGHKPPPSKPKKAHQRAVPRPAPHPRKPGPTAVPTPSTGPAPKPKPTVTPTPSPTSSPTPSPTPTPTPSPPQSPSETSSPAQPPDA